MKKAYVTPTMEMVEFNYNERVVASGTTSCKQKWVNIGTKNCESGNESLEWVGNQG